MGETMTIYHGSYMQVTKPDLNRGRCGTDFGRGFYVSMDKSMAEKWAARFSTPIVNVYTADFSNLKSMSFSLDDKWLDCVANCRSNKPVDFQGADLVIGATADDKLFNTISQYMEGLLPVEIAVDCLNYMEVGIQICCKTELALGCIKFDSSYMLDTKYASQLNYEIGQQKKIMDGYVSKVLQKYNRKSKEQSMPSLTTGIQIPDDVFSAINRKDKGITIRKSRELNK